jgi:hypothetical protein
MAFKKIFIIWLLISALCGGLVYLVKFLFRSHPTWPWAVPFLYIGVLILFALYALTAKKE